MLRAQLEDTQDRLRLTQAALDHERAINKRRLHGEQTALEGCRFTFRQLCNSCDVKPSPTMFNYLRDTYKRIAEEKPFWDGKRGWYLNKYKKQMRTILELYVNKGQAKVSSFFKKKN